MRMFAVSDDRDTLTGLRLAGIDGRFVSDKKETEAAIQQVRETHNIAVLLITESCANIVPDTVTELKLSATNPLLVIIPGSNGSTRSEDSITGLIREAIGIKI